MSPYLNNLRAIGLFLYVMLGNALTIATVRHLTDPARDTHFHIFQIVFLTSLIAALGFLPWMLRHGKAALHTGQLRLFTMRSLLEFASFSASFYAITLLPLPMHTALLFMAPVFGTIIALLVLREHGSWVSYACIATGFLGVLIITRPSFEVADHSTGILFAMLAALGFAMCGTIIKILTRTQPSDRIACYMLVMTSLIAAPFALAQWQMPTLHDLPWFLALGAIAWSIQQAVAKALSQVPYITLIPLNFAQLMFVSIIAYLAFDQQVGLYTVLGSLLILAATVFNAWYSARHAREMAAKEDLNPLSEEEKEAA